MSEQIQYIGARYVVKIYENSTDPSSAEWQANVNYEPLVLVTYNMGSYLSKKNVPASIGNPAENPAYWVQTGFYNGQIAELQHLVDELNTSINNEVTARENADNSLSNTISTVSNNLNTEINNRTTAVNNLSLQLTNEASNRTSADSLLQSQIDNIVAPSGEAPNPTEITNARIGADGVTYDSLGEAIRTQIGDLINTEIDNGTFNICDTFDTSDGTSQDITFTAIDNKGAFHISGTATAQAGHNLFVNNNELPKFMEYGKYYLIKIDGNVPSTGFYVEIYHRKNNSWSYGKAFASDGYYMVDNDATGLLIRFRIDSGITIDTDVKLSILTINPNNPLIRASNSNYGVQGVIEWCITNFGRCIIGKGSHKITAAINIPNNGELIGYGNESIIETTNDINGVIVGSNCTVKDLKIVAHQTPSFDARYHGVLVSGENKGTTILHNLFIEGFEGAGIKSADTGYYVENSITADGCTITGCFYGIDCRNHGEFGRYTNMNCYGNDQGLHNMSGNNKYVNCSFTDNRINVRIDGSGSTDGANNGHGCLIGCDINHADDNSIVIQKIDYGFIISGCNIWDGDVLIENNSIGITFDNNIIGDDNPTFAIYGTSKVFLKDNLFDNVPTFNVSNSALLVKINNYLFDGTAIA